MPVDVTVATEQELISAREVHSKTLVLDAPAGKTR